ncbi:MAG TPA: ABC transporter permease [Anaerohalosphaeraceae bacterium]|jgi:lipooligosaccharide transport system permease protein|nr:ABC transporter permease [Anaerohalosphaeraceae bacterium]HRT50537.1 ABC transporter permease [Anaerohalosphaeraceae bacterium]HRT86467.1 ABC transporter permease [Anaerohalosphaeraceae bacterium]
MTDPTSYPPLYRRLYSVWFRHMRVYTRHLLSNGLPPFLEPLIFLAGIGLGLGRLIGTMDGLPYMVFLGTGLPVTAAMWTSAFECSYGTFIRLEFEKVYDGMLAAPLTAENLILGEIIWAGTKGLFFSFSVICILLIFGIVRLPWALLAPFVGFLTGVMFGCLSLWITSFVKTINHFNFYMTGLLSPMFFFSGVVFPVSELPRAVQPFAELVPLTHAVYLARAVTLNDYRWRLLADFAYVVLFTAITGLFAVKRLKKRLVY